MKRKRCRIICAGSKNQGGFEPEDQAALKPPPASVLRLQLYYPRTLN